MFFRLIGAEMPIGAGLGKSPGLKQAGEKIFCDIFNGTQKKIARTQFKEMLGISLVFRL